MRPQYVGFRQLYRWQKQPLHFIETRVSAYFYFDLASKKENKKIWLTIEDKRYFYENFLPPCFLWKSTYNPYLHPALKWFNCTLKMSYRACFVLCIHVLCVSRLTPHGCTQCCGSMTFWGGSGSGSADPWLWLMDSHLDPDPDPGSLYFRHWPSRWQQKSYFYTIFSAYNF